MAAMVIQQQRLRFFSALVCAFILLFGFRSGYSQPTDTGGWQVTQHILDNGLTVIILEDHRAPVATLQVWYQVGSRNERPGITGISHLLEHLMFRGTPTYGK